MYNKTESEEDDKCHICGEINCEKQCSWFDLDTDFTEEEIQDHKERFLDIYAQDISWNFNQRINELFRK